MMMRLVPISFCCNLVIVLLPLQQQVFAIRRLPQDLLLEKTNVLHHHPKEAEEEDNASSSEHGRRLQQDWLHRLLKTKKSSSSSSSSVSLSSIPSSPDEHLVTSLPLLSDDEGLTTSHWAGHLPASPGNNDKFLFYWLFAPDTTTTTTDLESVPDEPDIPLIIWLNGGPGCSSMDGLFLENGPLRFVPVDESSPNTYRLTTTKYSWHHAPAYVVYIDQPVGTGLSFTRSRTYPSNDEQVNQDFYYFLQQFVQLHADKFLVDTTDTNGNNSRKKFRRPLYFTGESHAGHYIPSMMAYILDQNDKDDNNENALLPLSGAAIGNGWIDPRFQYAAAHAAYGHGLIGIAQRNALDRDEYECRKGVEQNFPVNMPTTRNLDEINPQQQQQHQTRELVDTSICFGLLDDVVDPTAQNYKVSQYDVRVWEKKRQDRSFPLGHKIVESYLGQSRAASFPQGYSNADVLQAIHATASRNAGQIYQECTDPPYNALSHQDALGVVPEIVKILEYGRSEKKIRLLFFNGINDLICNHVGNELALENLPWTGRDNWILATRFAWKAKNIDPESPYINSMVSGYYKALENLAFLKVMDSGHMVPMDVPDVALDMIRTFVFEQEFEQYDQGLDTAKTSLQCDACLECPTVSPSSSSRTNSKNTHSKTSSSQQDEEANELGRFVIAHAWMGAILGVVVFGMAILCKRQQGRRMDSTSSYSLELQSVPPNNSNGLGTANIKYRDEEPNSFDDEEEESEDDVADYEGGGGGTEYAYNHDHPSNGDVARGRGRPSPSLKTPPAVV